MSSTNWSMHTRPATANDSPLTATGPRLGRVPRDPVAVTERDQRERRLVVGDVRVAVGDALPGMDPLDEGQPWRAGVIAAVSGTGLRAVAERRDAVDRRCRAAPSVNQLSARRARRRSSPGAGARARARRRRRARRPPRTRAIWAATDGCAGSSEQARWDQTPVTRPGRAAWARLAASTSAWPVVGMSATTAEARVELELDARRGSRRRRRRRRSRRAARRCTPRPRHLPRPRRRTARPGRRASDRIGPRVAAGAQLRAPRRAGRPRASRRHHGAAARADSTMPWPYPSAFTTAIRSRPPTCSRRAATLALIASRSTIASARGGLSAPGDTGWARGSVMTLSLCQSP